jgi:hypothetical protein
MFFRQMISLPPPDPWIITCSPVRLQYPARLFCAAKDFPGEQMRIFFLYDRALPADTLLESFCTQNAGIDATDKEQGARR